MKTKNLNIEAQMADQEAIAAIEKLSGMYYSAYYDQSSIEIMCNPVDFMISGVPMKKRHLPPNYLYEYYRSSEFNGYLAESKDIRNRRFERAQVRLYENSSLIITIVQEYGYDINPLPEYLYVEKKDPRCILHRVAPGSLFSLSEKTVLRPFARQ